MMAAAAAFASGILAARYIYHPPWFWLACSALAAMVAILSLRRNLRLSYAAALLLVLCAGAFVSQAHESRKPTQPGILNFTSGDRVVVRGWLMRDGIVRTAKDGWTDESIDVAVESVTTDAGTFPVSGGMRLTLYLPRSAYEAEDSEDDGDAVREPLLPHYLYGQRVELTAKLHPPVNYKNPGAFDYVSYLKTQGIQALGSSKADSVSVLPGFSGSKIERWRTVARRSVLSRIHAIWPEQQALLLDAMLVGERAYLSRDTRDEFQRSGTYHVLVVSGMNVAILAVGVLWFLRRLRAGSELATVITLLLTCGYAMLTDLGAPILRSVLMIAIYQVTRLLYRDGSPLNAVGAAALALLAFDPKSLFDPSFQLTFISVVVIAGVAVPILERTVQPYREALPHLFIIGYDQAVAPKLAQWRIDLRMIIVRLSKLVGSFVARHSVTGILRIGIAAFELATVSALMQVALALPMAWYFHRLPPRALLANLAVVPLTSVLMPSAVVAVVVSYVSTSAAKVVGVIAATALDGITGTVHSLGGVHPADVRIATPTVLVGLIAAGCICAALLLVRRRWYIAIAGVLLLIGSSAYVRYAHAQNPATGRLEVTAIDVGQGESLLLVTPRGKTLLLDSGGMLGFSRSEFDVGEEVTSAYLWSRGINHLDAIAFSHPHSDHIGGMRAIVRNFHPDEIWYARANDTALRQQLLATCETYGVREKLRHLGERFDFGGVEFEVLSPADDVELKKRQEDDQSMVLRVSFGQSSALLPGDVHKKAEQSLLGSDLKSNLLKIPHHGSNTSTTPEFLEKVHPDFAVISAGTRNQFRHPRPEILKRLSDAHVRTFRTDLFGPVTFYMDGKTLTPSVPR